MATADQSSEVVTNARDYVLQELKESDTPVSPSELAGGYGCTNDHIRHVLADLKEEGLVERPGHGSYMIAQKENDGGEVTEIDGPSMAGGPPSGAHDTTDADAQVPETMPTADELERQRDLVEDGDDQDADDQLEADDDRPNVDDDQDATDAEVREAVDDLEDGSAGIPIPVSKGTLAVGLVALIAAYYWFVVRDDGNDSEDEQAAQQTQTQSSGSGLVEGI